MMKAFFLLTNILNVRLVLFTLLGLIVFSCKTGDTIADKGIIQKRKYQKGYHVNIKTPFDSRKNSAHHEATAEETFTASLRASLESNSNEPVLAKPVAKESKLETETTEVKRRKESKKGNNLKREYHGEATASIGEVSPLITERNVYRNENQIQSQPQDYYSARRLSTLALLSFIFGILSIFILGIPFGIAAVVLGILGIVQVEKNRDTYKGQGFAIAGLVIGLIAIIVVAVYLASLA